MDVVDAVRRRARLSRRARVGVAVDDDVVVPAVAVHVGERDHVRAEASRDVVATVENNEAVESVWITPSDALTHLKMVFPTIKNLEALRGFDSADALIASRRGAEIKAIEPVLVNGRPELR